MPNLAAKELCTGCTACFSACPKSCISMAADENGFLYPVIDTVMCTQCGLCEKSCPILHPPAISEKLPLAYAAYSKDEAIRLDSSSGGIFTELAKAVLKEGGAVFGAAYDDQFRVLHICVENETDLSKLRGAKYSQSNLCSVLPDVQHRLDHNQLILFSGTPCQIAGLKSFLRREYENLLTVDFVCHSVPSPLVWQKYIEYRAQQDNNGIFPISVNLRFKGTGWTKYQYSNLFEYEDGHSHCTKSCESLYMKLFVGGYINRESCANCQFKGYHRSSDLTIGDFWGIWDITPEMDDNKGTSLVLLQSEKGKELCSKIQHHILSKEVSLTQTSQYNPAMLQPFASNPNRIDTLTKIKVNQFDTCQKLFYTKKPSFIYRAKRKLSRILRNA